MPSPVSKSLMFNLSQIVVLTCLCSVSLAEDLDPRGRPQQELVKVDSARYFVWHDSEGWHLRTASKNMRKFTGSVKVINGTFGPLRPIGLDTKGSGKDAWGVSPDRTEVRFELNTGGSFDGFDFDVKGQATQLECDLKVFGTQSRPGAIFIGKAEKHPQEAKFSLPANPE